MSLLITRTNVTLHVMYYAMAEENELHKEKVLMWSILKVKKIDKYELIYKLMVKDTVWWTQKVLLLGKEQISFKMDKLWCWLKTNNKKDKKRRKNKRRK